MQRWVRWVRGVVLAKSVFCIMSEASFILPFTHQQIN
jgi:hypothetical protein